METLIKQLEDLIRMNSDSEATKILLGLKPKQIPSRHRTKLANLARRGGLATKSLEILRPNVIDGSHILASSTDEERAEYAQSLYRIGASSEALRFFDSININSFPKVLLYRSFVYFSQWNYGDAIPLLQRYLGFTDPDSYDALVANLNLAAALTAEKRVDEAKSALERLRTKDIEKKYPRLHSNWLELSAQLEIECRNFSKAKEYLAAGVGAHGAKDSIYLLFLKKWECVSLLTREGVTAPALAALRAVKQQATNFQHWETLRDCELIEARFTENFDLLKHLFFGTPYLKFKERVLRETGANWDPGQTYVRIFLGERSEPLIRLLPSVDRVLGLKSSSLLIRLLSVLNSDFYRPLTVGNLFQSLFPDHHFDPNSSVNRIYQDLFRLRVWLEKEKIPLNIVVDSGSYYLRATGPLAIEVPREPLLECSSEYAIQRLYQKFTNLEFKAREACEELGSEKTSTSRILYKAIESGLLEKLYQGPKTRYRFRAK